MQHLRSQRICCRDTNLPNRTHLRRANKPGHIPLDVKSWNQSESNPEAQAGKSTSYLPQKSDAFQKNPATIERRAVAGIGHKLNIFHCSLLQRAALEGQRHIGSRTEVDVNTPGSQYEFAPSSENNHEKSLCKQ